MPPTQDDIETAYRKHAHSVLRRAAQLLGSEQDAREVLQEVFVSLIERPTQFAERSSLLSWLYAAATHRCLKRLRDSRTQQRLLSVNPGLTDPGTHPLAPDHAIELRRLLQRLPDELADVAVYHFLDALSYDEMAEVMRCSRRKVAYLMERLRTFTSNEASKRNGKPVA